MSFDRIRSRLEGEPPQGWKPQVGDSIVGVLLSVEDSTQDRFGIYPVLTLEDEEGREWEVHCFHKVLKGRVPAMEIGDQIGIRYLGAMKAGYENYKVVIEKAEQEDSF